MRGNKKAVTLPFEIKKMSLSTHGKEYISSTLELEPYEAFVAEV